MAVWAVSQFLHLSSSDKGFIGIDTWRFLGRYDRISNKTINQGFDEIIWYEPLPAKYGGTTWTTKIK